MPEWVSEITHLCFVINLPTFVLKYKVYNKFIAFILSTMNEDIYATKTSPSTNSSNVNKILGAIIVILVLVFGTLMLLKTNNSVQTDNTVPSITPTYTVTVSQVTVTNSPVPSITSTPTPITSPTITPTGTPVTLYFYKSPIKPNQDTNEVYPIVHYTTETGFNLIPFALKEFFIGLTAQEQAAGYIYPYTLSGSSTCGGSNYKFSYDLPTLKLTICRQIDPTPESGDGGGSAGSSLRAMSRVLKVLTSSFKVGGVTKVAVYDLNGACYASDTGLNGCTP